ncbi:MAG: family 16 glycoside hydrolase, partial [Verrucomicrobiota bacterium]
EDTGTSWDRKLVYVTTDGTNWSPILQISGPNKQWTSQIVELSQFAGQRIRLRFFFDSIDGVNNGYRGWYLDNVIVNIVGSDTLFVEGFTSTNLAAWTRAAGAANWMVTDGAVRAWRIGNDDNILYAGDANWSNYTASVDIRYNKQGPYFNNAELYLRYLNRDNFVKVDVENYYGFWRLKYTVRVATNNSEQGWIYEFKKTNSPVENTWYNLKVRAETTNFTVFFNGEQVGGFTSKEFPYSKGKIAVGSRAVQLGVWEPQQGYFFIDDDEYSYYSAVEDDDVTIGAPLNLDWGYLQQFYPTLILPSTYVMNDTEVANVQTWITNGLHSVLATDGGVAMKNETNAFDLGRIENLFGVGTSTRTMSGINRTVLGTQDHYVTLDYAPDASLSATGSAVAFSALAGGVNLATAYTATNNALAFVCNVITNNAGAPAKVFCFNFGVDTQGQLTNSLKDIAKRAFEWSRGEAHKVRIELKYTPVRGSALDNFVVQSWDQWVLGGTGSNQLSLVLPDDGIMTGNNMYWVIYTYAWDATNAWIAHDGFYTSANDGTNGFYTSIPGKGLQILGITDKAFAGRDWDTWVAYNTTTNNNLSLAYGIKDKGTTQYEDNFNDGNYTGWNIEASPRIAWSVSNNALQAKVTSVTTGGYSYIYWNGLAVTGKNITIEYGTTFTNGARDGGVIFRGRVLYVNPNLCGWADNTPNYFSVNRPVTGKWQKVIVHIRDGSPYLMSDLYVDSKTVFLSEPIQVSSWTTNTVGFLSPYSNLNGVVQWDNVRIADEQYTVTYTNVSGEKVPTDAAQPPLWASIPDYD